MRAIRRSAATALAGVLVAALAPSVAAAQDLAVRDVRVFDGSAVREGVTVVVRDGRIEAAGEDVAVPPGVPVVEGAGRTLLPGLIDAHTHTFTEDDLRTALAFGVTTELDQFGTPELLRRMRDEQEAGRSTDRADLFGAGILATAPGGHGTQYGMELPTLTSPDQAASFVAARKADGSDWIKIVRTRVDRGFPTLDLDIVRAVVEAAHAEGLLAVVHVSSVDDALAVAEMGADGIVHTPDDRQPAADFGGRFASSGAFVVPTLTVIRGVATGGEGGAQMADPLLAPHLDPGQRSSLGSSFPRRDGSEAGWGHAAASVRLLDEAGVRILAGSDAPNPNTAHGATLHRELENLVEAGLTPVEALTAATSAAAAAFRLDDRGRIAPGLRADLLLVEGDPTIDVRATRRIAGVWKGGVRFDREGRRQAVAGAGGSPRPDVPAGGLISDFEAGPGASFGAWTTSTDAMIGGSSTASIAVEDGALVVEGDVAGAGMQTWAGAFLAPSGEERMAGVDLSDWSGLAFQVRAPESGTWTVMFFAEGSPMPVVRPFEAGPAWEEVRIDFADLAGLDPAGVAGVFIGRSGSPGPVALRIDDVRLLR